jgi:tetratricopeptide (TPR) repeat protein
MVAGRLTELAAYAAKKNELETALRHLSDAYLLVKNDAYLNRSIASVCLALGNQQFKLGDNARTKAPPDLQLARKFYSNAEAYYRKAAAINPLDAEVRDNLGLSLYRQGKKSEAFVEYLKATEINPSDSIAYRNSFLLALDLRNQNAAGLSFEHLSKMYPADLGVLKLGLDLYAHDYAKLSVFCDDLLRLAPTDAIVLLNKSVAAVNLGFAAYNSGQYQKAREYFEVAVGAAEKASSYSQDVGLKQQSLDYLEKFKSYLERTNQLLENH